MDLGWVLAAQISWIWAQHSSCGATPEMEGLQVSGFFPKMGILLFFGWKTLQTGEILSHCTVKENHLLTVGTKFNSGYFFNSISDMNRSVWTLSL